MSEPTPASAARPRIDAIDRLRGLAMVLMALDHARDFFSPSLGPQGLALPERIPDVGLGLFLTRWVTHFCAPVFVFLAGTSAWLWASRPGRTRPRLAGFLLTRGLWLILLEWTVVHQAWFLDLSYAFVVGQVIWALGVSMIVLAALVWLPLPLIAGIGLLMIAGHNFLDGSDWQRSVLATAPSSRATWQHLWAVLHLGGFVPLGGRFGFAPMYPLIPWIGVMAVGYAFAPLLRRPTPTRRRWCLLIGLGATVLFVLLRASGAHGDPRPWSAGPSAVDSLIAFLNCEKYPPSLLFLLMTLGPALAALPLLERVRGRIVDVLTTIGRVPLLFYVAHLYLLHVGALGWGALRFGREAWSWGLVRGFPETFPIGLWVAYLAWAGVIVLAYPLCRWFAGVKQRHRSAWLSYL